MKNLVCIISIISCLTANAQSQQIGRILGARAFQSDDGTGSGYTLTWDVAAPLDRSYQIHWPTTPPASDASYCAIDASGKMWWAESIPLPSLAAGSIWCGNAFGAAEQMMPGPIGSYLMIDNLGMPEWTMTIPSLQSISADQLTSGTLQPGTDIAVGTGSSITPSAGGIVQANELSGAGAGKYSGAIAIPQNAPSIDILYSGILGSSVVMLSISDPNSANFTVIPDVTNITPGVGFTVSFTAPYPNPAGTLNYVVINP